MARLGGNLAGLFTNNPVNAVSATGQPLIGGSQSANLLARSVGGLLGRDMRTGQERTRDKQREAYENFDPNDPTSMNQIVQAIALTDPVRAIELANAFKRKKDAELEALAKRAEDEFKNDSYLEILNEVQSAQAAGTDLDLDKVFEISEAASLDYKTVSDLLKQTESAARTGTRTSTKVGVIKAKDSDGKVAGQYNVTSVYDPINNTTQMVNTPIGSSPAFDTLKGVEVDFVSSTTGLSGFEANTLKQANEKLGSQLNIIEQEFTLGSQTAQDAQDKYMSASEGVTTAKRMLSSLDIIETGGTFASAMKALGDALGTTPADVGQFAVDAGNLMVQKLRAFGTNPTDGERRAAEALVARIQNSKGLNRAIISSFLQEMERRQKINKYRSRTILDDSVPGGRRYPSPDEVIEYMEEVYTGTGFAGNTKSKYSFEEVE